MFGSYGRYWSTKSRRERKRFACTLRRFLSTPVCLEKMINDPRYVEGDINRRDAEDGGKETRREKMTMTCIPSSRWTPSHLRGRSFLAVWATRDIKSGEKLFGNKVTEY